MIEVVEETSLGGLRLLRRGKVRDIYDLGRRLLLVATDRVSAFDRVLPTAIPDKGRVLTQLARYWFEKTEDIVPNHLVSVSVEEFPDEVRAHERTLRGRSMIVRKAKPVEVECVVRGYLCGTAWQEYGSTGGVGGERLPGGLGEFERLSAPIFTPAVKRHEGHDENLSFTALRSLVGRSLADRLRDLSLELYDRGHAHSAERGLILADTKFEFGWEGARLILIDEVLTPDSSRFWPAESYGRPGGPESADKQIVRDYLRGVGWDGQPPAPVLPDAVVARVRERYLDLYRRTVGEPLGR